MLDTPPLDVMVTVSTLEAGDGPMMSAVLDSRGWTLPLGGERAYAVELVVPDQVSVPVPVFPITSRGYGPEH